jgi:hypothetical protein
MGESFERAMADTRRDAKRHSQVTSKDFVRCRFFATGKDRSGKSFDGGGFLERPARKDGSSR